jgi:hypothetical protein
LRIAGIEGVQAQVDDHLLDLYRVAQQVAVLRLQAVFERDVTPDVAQDLQRSTKRTSQPAGSTLGFRPKRSSRRPSTRQFDGTGGWTTSAGPVVPHRTARSRSPARSSTPRAGSRSTLRAARCGAAEALRRQLGR